MIPELNLSNIKIPDINLPDIKLVDVPIDTWTQINSLLQVSQWVGYALIGFLIVAILYKLRRVFGG